MHESKLQFHWKFLTFDIFLAIISFLLCGFLFWLLSFRLFNLESLRINSVFIVGILGIIRSIIYFYLNLAGKYKNAAKKIRDIFIISFIVCVVAIGAFCFNIILANKLMIILGHNNLLFSLAISLFAHLLRIPVIFFLNSEYDKTYDLYKKGFAHYEKQEYDDAIWCFQVIDKTFPGTHYGTNTMLGKIAVYVDQNRFQEIMKTPPVWINSNPLIVKLFNDAGYSLDYREQ